MEPIGCSAVTCPAASVSRLHHVEPRLAGAGGLSRTAFADARLEAELEADALERYAEARERTDRGAHRADAGCGLRPRPPGADGSGVEVDLADEIGELGGLAPTSRPLRRRCTALWPCPRCRDEQVRMGAAGRDRLQEGEDVRSW
jgi:hypothetical protein